MKIILRNAAMIFAVILLSCATASAQEKKERSSWGYGFVAPSGADSTFLLHFGGGGEGVIHKGLGIGGEIGYVGAAREPNVGVGLASINGVYVFGKKDSKLAPFVTGGYTMIFPSDAFSMINFGGGVNYWFHNRAGLRLEFRDHVSTSSGSFHIYGFRAGITFR
ncbi:MAG: hypothetical protein AB1631_27195 [Acidobacteriota bacterium]